MSSMALSLSPGAPQRNFDLLLILLCVMFPDEGTSPLLIMMFILIFIYFIISSMVLFVEVRSISAERLNSQVSRGWVNIKVIVRFAEFTIEAVPGYMFSWVILKYCNQLEL